MYALYCGDIFYVKSLVKVCAPCGTYQKLGHLVGKNKVLRSHFFLPDLDSTCCKGDSPVICNHGPAESFLKNQQMIKNVENQKIISSVLPANIKGPVTLRRMAPTYANVWEIPQVVLPANIKGPVTLRRMAPTYANVWEIPQVGWYTLSYVKIPPNFVHA